MVDSGFFALLIIELTKVCRNTWRGTLYWLSILPWSDLSRIFHYRTMVLCNISISLFSSINCNYAIRLHLYNLASLHMGFNSLLPGKFYCSPTFHGCKTTEKKYASGSENLFCRFISDMISHHPLLTVIGGLPIYLPISSRSHPFAVNISLFRRLIALSLIHGQHWWRKGGHYCSRGTLWHHGDVMFGNDDADMLNYGPSRRCPLPSQKAWTCLSRSSSCFNTQSLWSSGTLKRCSFANIGSCSAGVTVKNGWGYDAKTMIVTVGYFVVVVVTCADIGKKQIFIPTFYHAQDE